MVAPLRDARFALVPCGTSASVVQVCVEQVEPGIGRVQALADISRSALRCHSNETRAPIANPLNSAQRGDTLYHSPSYIRVRAVV